MVRGFTPLVSIVCGARDRSGDVCLSEGEECLNNNGTLSGHSSAGVDVYAGSLLFQVPQARVRGPRACLARHSHCLRRRVAAFEKPLAVIVVPGQGGMVR